MANFLYFWTSSEERLDGGGGWAEEDGGWEGSVLFCFCDDCCRGGEVNEVSADVYERGSEDVEEPPQPTAKVGFSLGFDDENQF